MNAIPLINNNVMRQNPYGNETQLRQEINTSLVALKKEAGTLEGLINEAAQMLVTINNRIATLENDTVKKSDVVDVVQSGNLQPVTSNAVSGAISALDVASVGGSGKYISAISEADGKINATATDLGNMVPVDTVTSGNMHSVTSNAVNNAIATASNHKIDEYVRNDTITAPVSGWRSTCWMFPKKGKYLVEVYRDKIVTTNIQKIENNVTSSYETRGTDYMRYAIIETTVDRAQVQIAGNFTEGVTYNLVLRLTQIKYD